MKLSSIAAVVGLAVSQASGHYIFQRFAVGSTKYGVYEGIRQNTNQNHPVTDLASPDLRCNVGGASGAQTSVIDVKPGETFSFTLDTAVYHQGPISFFLSKAPSSVRAYDGSGKWLKFKDIGPTFSNGQATWPLRRKFRSPRRYSLSGLMVLILHRDVRRADPNMLAERRVPPQGEPAGHPQPMASRYPAVVGFRMLSIVHMELGD
ncbi:hypothetical protein VDGD_06675 [Verticillium dahliae]|nr:hypothetical protein VDGD_06675 [Verticillium dahliae]